MKHFFPATTLALLLGFAPSLFAASAASNSWSALQPEREQVIASLNVVELLKRHHYNKPPLNDERSLKIYDSYLKLLDPSRSYFTAADIAVGYACLLAGQLGMGAELGPRTQAWWERCKGRDGYRRAREAQKSMPSSVNAG